MLGIEFDFKMKPVQNELMEQGIFTGGSSNPNLLRILPPLNIGEAEAEHFATLLCSDVGGSGELLRVKLDGAVITILSPQAYQDRYGYLASPLDMRSSIFGAIVIRVNDLAEIRGIALTAGIPVIDDTNRLVIRHESFDSVLEFVC